MFFNIKRIQKLTALSLLGVFALTACSSDVDSKEDNSLDVYTSFSAVTALTMPIVSDETNITQLTEPNVEAHDFEPSGRDVASIADSELFIYNGLDIEHYIEDLTNSIDSETIFVDTSFNIPYVLEEDNSVDPHIWLSFEHVKVQVENIANSLISVDSENTDKYNENLAKFVSDIEILEKQYDEFLNTKKGQTVVVSHPAYNYLFDKYDIKQIPIQQNHEVEPTISELKFVIDYINNNNVKYIIAPSSEVTKPMQTVLDETDAEVIVVNNLENITGEITKDTYINIMSENLEFIRIVFN